MLKDAPSRCLDGTIASEAVRNGKYITQKENHNPSNHRLVINSPSSHKPSNPSDGPDIQWVFRQHIERDHPEPVIQTLGDLKEARPSRIVCKAVTRCTAEVC